MKLNYFQARSHATEQFGHPVHECEEWISWRPSRVDLRIELSLAPSGSFFFVVNGNHSRRFRADYAKLNRLNLVNVVWLEEFSWQFADRLVREFAWTDHEA